MVELPKDETSVVRPFCSGGLGLHWPTPCPESIRDIHKTVDPEISGKSTLRLPDLKVRACSGLTLIIVHTTRHDTSNGDLLRDSLRLKQGLNCGNPGNLLSHILRIDP